MNAAKKVVLVRTRQDKPTTYSHTWAGQLKQELQDNGWQVIDCETDKALRTEVESALAVQDNRLFVFYGHGAPDSLIGQDSVNVLDLQNAATVKNCIVYVMACSSAQQLGQKTVTEGAVCYLGYHDDVYITFPFADSLGKCVNSGLSVWLENPALTAEDVRQIIRRTYTHWIDYFQAQGGTESVLWAADLRHNRDALRLLGNQAAGL